MPETPPELFELSPMQGGMFFQTRLDDSGTSGYDIEQLHLSLAEALDRAQLELAWKLVVHRHPALSASFHWEGVERPLQAFHPGVAVPVEIEDWSDLAGSEPTSAEFERRRGAFLARDRSRGFDLRVPPLMRVTVFPIGPDRSELVWTVHHILLDGRSMAPVLREVFRAYAAFVRGEGPALPPPPRPFGDYLRWLERRDQGPSHDFFKALLRGKPTPTPLPFATSNSRDQHPAEEGVFDKIVAGEIRDAAHALANRTGTTMATVVQAAMAMVLYRLTGDEDVLFGTVRACRASALDGAASETIGLIMNPVPVRLRIDEDRTVRELLGEARSQSLSMRDHELLPLAEVQRQSELPPGTPLFETLLMFDDHEINQRLRVEDPQWQTRWCTLHEKPSPPLTVTVFDDLQLELRILFDPVRLNEAAVARIGAYLETTLASLAASESRKLCEVEILPASERRWLLTTCNDTAHPFPSDSCLHELFERQVRAQPEATAVECSDARLTYRELEERANQLAHALIARGARPGVFIGICLDRSLDLITAMLAVVKSGAAYLPMSADYPRERLSYMLEESKAPLTVTQERFKDLVPGRLLVLDGADRPALAQMPRTRASGAATASEAAYGMYTSGSTGRPKGVVVPHRSALNTLAWVNRTFDVGPGDRLLFVTSPCFDLSVYDIFGGLAAGATVVVARSETLRDPKALAALLVDARVTIWNSAPATLQQLMSFIPAASRESPLRLVLLSGDWIPLPLPDLVRGAFPAAEVCSVGGPTETAIWPNYYRIGETDPRWKSIPYGRPIQNVRAYLLDGRMRPVAIGVPGDLYYGGVCVARGYLERPDLTSERFLPDALAPETLFPGEQAPARIYKSGDLARFREDGVLELLGRSDFQLKVRGFRVELGEIEGVLASLPEVEAAVCTGFTDPAGQKAVVAYVVLKPETALDEAALKKEVAEKLPGYMVPAQVVQLGALPLSSNGKVDRKALPSPLFRPATAKYLPPRTEAERRLAALWRELLRVDRVGITDSFFALGGHSLLAVLMTLRVKTELGFELPLSQILEHPTIEGLLSAIDSRSKDAVEARHLVTLNCGGSRPPMVLVSGIGGYGFVFKGLSSFLSRDQPLHVLNAIGAEDRREGVDHTIEEMAAIYLPQMLAVCPTGPIVIGGYSFGILVAFELIRRLRVLRREVPLLISFDGFAPGFPELRPLPLRLREHLETFLAADATGRRKYLRDRIGAIRARLLKTLGRPEDAVPAIPFADPETDRRLREVSAGLWRARARYHPTHRHPGDLLLLKSKVSEHWIGNKMDDPLYGWRERVEGRVEVAMVPGAHLSLFDQANQRLMAEIVDQAVTERIARPSP